MVVTTESPTPEWTVQCLARLRGVAVLVVGDIMLDEYLWGDVSRVSPEAPVPVVEVGQRTAAPGGAANAAAGVAALDARAWLAGVVGDDANGVCLRAVLSDAGVDLGGVVIDPARVTTTKSRLLARGQHVVRMDREHRTPLPADVEARLRDFVRATIDLTDAVVLSDYAKGVVSASLARDVIDFAREAGKPVIADPAGPDYSKYAGATIVTPSVDEVESAVGRRLRTEADLSSAGMQLATQLSGTRVLITRGAQGMWLMSPAGVERDTPARARSVYDITGAGDTVVAILAVALGRGLALAAAIDLANTAAGISVGKVGTASVSLDEIARDIS